MKVSLNWLREFVECPKDSDSLSELLTMAGIEVEGIHTQGVNIEKIVVAQILESERHPNADRLSVCKVDDGSGSPLQIVCGAKNYKVGDKVPLAQAGAVLPGDFKIKVGKLRGVDSQGMMCSAKELGLAEDAEGLLILNADLQPGTPLANVFPSDTILDLEITPNRPDLLSHEGIAREIAALTGRTAKSAHLFSTETADAEALQTDAAASPFYTVRTFENTRVSPSPDWLKVRLEAIGLRSINNVVDITNLVLMETGQPLHTFDADKLRGALRVRFARKGEGLEALNGKTYTLTEEDVVIADGSGPVAIAGIMGGQSTAVSDSTTRVMLESATFNPSLIRRTARRLGLSSDSSYRFERGVDVAGVLRGSQRARDLLQELAEAMSGALQTSAGTESMDLGALLMGLTPVLQVPLRFERIASLLGAPVPEAKIDQILTALGLSKSTGGWAVPSFRPDLTREIDLIEEIARVVGIHHFPARTQAWFSESSITDHRHDQLMDWRRRAAGQGLYEARTLTLVSERMSQSPFATRPILRVKNPLNEDQVVLRPTLVPGLLDAAGRNARGGSKCIRLFEVGRVFAAEAGEERTSIAVLLSGPTQPTSWRPETAREVDLFDLKGVLSKLLNCDVSFKPVAATGYLAVAVHIEICGNLVGMAGQLRPSEARQLDIQGAILAAEIDLESLLSQRRSPSVYKALPKFPSVTRDIALIAPRSLAHSEIERILLSAKEELLTGVELFDVFTDAQGIRVPADAKSLAYSLTYRAADRTLTADEVNAAHSRLKQKIASELGVTARE
jgi:phenylalanyl-tRNA synthetase beta chain